MGQSIPKFTENSKVGQSTTKITKNSKVGQSIIKNTDNSRVGKSTGLVAQSVMSATDTLGHRDVHCTWLVCH